MKISWQHLAPSYCDKLGLLAKLAAAESLSLYVVGGCLRDAIMQRSCADYDLAANSDPTSIAKQFAQKTNGHWFSLDKKRGYSRVIIKNKKNNHRNKITEYCVGDALKDQLQFDFAPLRAQTIDEDLKLRDFTINAMAVKLSTLNLENRTFELIDPCNGLKDLQQQRLRMCGERVLFDDPLRIVKGLRHCAQLGLTMCGETSTACRCYAPLISTIAGERIREEISKILIADHPQVALQIYFQCELDKVFTSQLNGKQLLKEYTRLENIFDNIEKGSSPEFKQIINRCTGDGFTIKSSIYLLLILRCCRLKHNVLDEVISRLHFNRRVAKIIAFATKINAEELHSFTLLHYNKHKNKRALLLWLQRYGAPLPEGVFIICCLSKHSIDTAQIVHLYRFCEQILVNGRIINLLSVQQIQEHRPDCNGKKLGVFLDQLQQHEISGQIETEQHAIDYLKKWDESD